MKPIIRALLAFVSTLFRSRLALQLEIVALRHQLTVYQRTTKRPRINPGDRIFWSWLSRRWSGWRGALVFVQTRTVLAWQRKRFRDHWTKLSKRDRCHPQKFMPPSRPSHIHGVIHPGQGEPQLYNGSECNADACAV